MYDVVQFKLNANSIFSILSCQVGNTFHETLFEFVKIRAMTP